MGKSAEADVQPRARANIVLGSAIALIVVAAAVAFALGCFDAAGVESTRMRAVVHDGDGGVHELALDRDSETAIATGKGSNVVVVEDGAVFVREADCENQDCVRQGRIASPGRQIICLPHELWIEVVAEGGTSGAMDVGAAGDAPGDVAGDAPGDDRAGDVAGDDRAGDADDARGNGAGFDVIAR